MTELTHGRKVVVVLGVGRSGTSLAMQALEKLGVRVSENVIPPNVSNPKGFNEDADIIEIHITLLKNFLPRLNMPLPNGWLNTPEAKEAQQKLKMLVKHQITVAETEIWGFKDPRTATFLPMWIRIFNQLKVVPRFVLAVRNPEATIHSFTQQYGNDQAHSELIYLLRTLDALYYTGGDCHVLRYESWFTAPQRTLQDLADFVFDKPVDPLGIKVPLVNQLNRAGNVRIELHNPMVRSLSKALDDCANQTIDRNALMECVEAQRITLDSFHPWLVVTRDLQQQKGKLQHQLQQKNRQLENYEACQNRLKRQQAVTKELQLVASAYERLIQSL